MPTYLYQNPETKEVKEIAQSIREKHEYSENGLTWDRVFTIPNTSVDSKIPITKKDFLEKTKNKRGTLGNMFDAAQEASEKRKKIHGIDPVKMKWHDEYSAKRHGKRHPSYYRDIGKSE